MRNRAKAKTPRRGYEETLSRATREPMLGGCTHRPFGRKSTEKPPHPHEPTAAFFSNRYAGLMLLFSAHGRAVAP